MSLASSPRSGIHDLTKEVIAFKPEGDTLLKGEGKLTTDPEMKVLVTITFLGQDNRLALPHYKTNQYQKVTLLKGNMVSTK